MLQLNMFIYTLLLLLQTKEIQALAQCRIATSERYIFCYSLETLVIHAQEARNETQKLTVLLLRCFTVITTKMAVVNYRRFILY